MLRLNYCWFSMLGEISQSWAVCFEQTQACVRPVSMSLSDDAVLRKRKPTTSQWRLNVQWIGLRENLNRKP